MNTDHNAMNLALKREAREVKKARDQLVRTYKLLKNRETALAVQELEEFLTERNLI